MNEFDRAIDLHQERKRMNTLRDFETQRKVIALQKITIEAKDETIESQKKQIKMLEDEFDQVRSAGLQMQTEIARLKQHIRNLKGDSSDPTVDFDELPIRLITARDINSMLSEPTDHPPAA